jgi:hypothetical protein
MEMVINAGPEHGPNKTGAAFERFRFNTWAVIFFMVARAAAARFGL